MRIVPLKTADGTWENHPEAGIRMFPKVKRTVQAGIDNKTLAPSPNAPEKVINQFRYEAQGPVSVYERPLEEGGQAFYAVADQYIGRIVTTPDGHMSRGVGYRPTGKNCFVGNSSIGFNAGFIPQEEVKRTQRERKQLPKLKNPITGMPDFPDVKTTTKRHSGTVVTTSNGRIQTLSPAGYYKEMRSIWENPTLKKLQTLVRRATRVIK